jgi:hypothetical protein
MNSEEIKKRVLERVMAPYPKNCHVVPYSTPVVSFGNPETSTVATLGINPSSREFLGKGKNLLAAEEKRLVDLETLGLTSEINQLDLEQAEKVLSGCVQYFEGTTTYGWFLRLQEYVLDSVNASYKPSAEENVEGACHLDLVQWATDPVWRHLDKGIQKTLLESDLEFLRFQLTNYGFKKLFLNGHEVVNQFKRLGLTELTEVGQTPYQSHGNKSPLYRGKFGDTEVWGWGLNVGQKEITLSNLEDLSNWIGGDSTELTPKTLNLDEALIAFGTTRNKEYPMSDISKMKAVIEELGLSEFEAKAKFIRDVGDILHIHPDMLVAGEAFSGSRDRGVDPYPNYPHFFQLSGWSNKGSKLMESPGTPKVLCPVGFVKVVPGVVCDYCEEIHPKE